MKSPNRILLAILPVIALAVGLWLLLVSPKREEASDLESEAAALRGQVAEQEQLAATAEAAREDFPHAYRRLVVLGKAAPEDDDTSSFVIQLDRIASEAGIDFVSLTNQGGDSTGATAPAPVPQTPAQTAEESEQQVENVEETPPATQAPTEAQAALLPIGATVGPAGLPVMRYTLKFEGDFFRLADFLEGIDDMVRTRGKRDVAVRGRLVTVDSFDLTGGGADPTSTDGATSAQDPTLAAELTITTYLTPPDQGITGGATPTGPAPVIESAPASAPPAGGSATTASTVTP